MNSNCHTHMTPTRTSSPTPRSTAAHPQQPSTSTVPPGDHLLTTREAAVIIKVSVEALNKWRQRGLGPTFIKYPSGAVRYRLSVVLQFVNDCTAKR